MCTWYASTQPSAAKSRKHGRASWFRQTSSTRTCAPAAVLYAEKNPTVDFIRKSGESGGKSFQRMVDTFLLWRDHINHPDPELAIRMAFLVVASTLRDLVIFDRMRLMVSVIPVDDDLLKRELPRVFLGCLGIRSPD